MAIEEESKEFKDIQLRQLKALETLADYFNQEAEEKRTKRSHGFLTKLLSILAISLGSLFGAWELAFYLYEQWKISKMADQYAYVAHEIYYEEGNAEVALNLIEKSVDLKGNDPDHRYFHAYLEGMAAVRLLLNLDRPYTKEEYDQVHEALAGANLLETLDDTRVEPYILRGQIYTALEEYDRAKLQLEHAIKVAPDSSFAHLRLAMLHAKQKEFDQAHALIQKVLKLEPDSKWAYLWQGVVLTQERKMDEALKAYDKAIKIDNKFDLAYYNRGWIWLNQRPKDYEKARADFETASVINPDYKEAFYSLGMVYGYQNRYAIAESYMSKALTIDKKFLTAWKWRAIVKEEQKNYDAALEDFNTAITIDPSNADLYVRRGRLLEKMDAYEKALDDLRLAEEMDPQNKKIGLYIGRIFLKLEQAESAIKYYTKAIEIDAEYSEAYQERAQAYLKINDVEKASQDFDQAVITTKYRPERMLLSRGQFNEMQGNLEKALLDYQAASSKAKGKSRAPGYLLEAKLLIKMDKKQEAIPVLEKYLEIMPQDENTLALYMQLKENQ